ncbi:MAG: 30S ribosomal protein S16 [Anaerovoracaceae bacterium]
MVKIRLKRLGAHKKPFYRIVVADSRSARNGRFIEELGYYDPIADPAVIKINGEETKKWLNEGAQVSETVRSLLKKSGVIE